MNNNIEKLLSEILVKYNKQIDEIGYSFLFSQGYKTEGAMQSSTVRKQIKQEMKKRGEELRLCRAIKKDGRILIWFQLHNLGDASDAKPKATSRGLKLIMRAE